MRPHSLSELARRIAAGADPTKEFQEFLDWFYDAPTPSAMSECLREEPAVLEDAKLNALFGATADYLSSRYRLGSAPRWAFGPSRSLAEPWFTSPVDSPEMRDYMRRLSSPNEFRSRNIFTEETPLRRARTWQAEQRLEGRETLPERPARAPQLRRIAAKAGLKNGLGG